MRKALALLATVGAFLFLTAGIVSAQQYPGTTTTTVPGTETITPTTVPTTAPPATTAPPTNGDVGAGGATLPATGSESLPLAQLAIVLVAAGGIALMAVRRQAPAQVSTDS
jgi:LPXTG-motif cell wall-anchored protein